MANVFDTQAPSSTQASAAPLRQRTAPAQPTSGGFAASGRWPAASTGDVGRAASAVLPASFATSTETGYACSSSERPQPAPPKAAATARARAVHGDGMVAA